MLFLPCSPLFGRLNKINVLSGLVYLLIHRHSPELRALTVAFSVGLADGFVGEQTWLGSSNPWKSLDRSPPEIPGRGWSLPHRGRPDIEELVLTMAVIAQRIRLSDDR
jgi:hypothetical protein